MRNRIAYTAVDEVNQMLALGMAREFGAAVVRTPPLRATRGASIMATMHDLDHVSRQQREAILTELLSGPTPVPVAVHGYNLREDEIAALRANGVIVSEALEPTLIRRLCQESESRRDLGPVEVDREKGEVKEELIEPATLCELVRSLASRAHRTITRTPPEHDELVSLRRQLADLQSQLDRLRRSHASQFEELQRWLESLARRVNAEARY